MCVCIYIYIWMQSIKPNLLGQVPLSSPRTPVSMQLGTCPKLTMQSQTRSPTQRNQKRTQACKPLHPHTHVRTALIVHGGWKRPRPPPTRIPLAVPARSLWASLLVVQTRAPRASHPSQQHRQRKLPQRRFLQRRARLAAKPPTPRVRARTPTSAASASNPQPRTPAAPTLR